VGKVLLTIEKDVVGISLSLNKSLAMIITKEQVLETIQALPQQFSLEELVERLSELDAEAIDNEDITISQTESVTPSAATGKISALRKRIHTPMSTEEIEQQLESLYSK